MSMGMSGYVLGGATEPEVMTKFVPFPLKLA